MYAVCPCVHSCLVACAAIATPAFGQPADLVLRNGKIVTMNAAQPAAQPWRCAGTGSRRWAATRSRRNGSALAPRSSTCTACWRFRGSSRTRALHGAGRVSPGAGSARSAHVGDTWRGARAAKQAKPGEWIVGRGWHQSKGSARRAQRGRLSAARLSRQVSPSNPVLLTHASGHAAFVNAKPWRRRASRAILPTRRAGKS